MKIQLTIRGGSYGELQLQSVETNDLSLSFPVELLEIIKSPGFESYNVCSETSHVVAWADTNRVQTGREVYELTITDDEGISNQYSFQHSALEPDADLKKLIDFIWSVSKPI